MLKQSDLKDRVVHSFPGLGIFTTETIKAYHESDWLVKMFTTIVIHKDKNWVKALKIILPSYIHKFKNRNFNQVPLKKIGIYPYKELIRLFAVRFLSLSTTDRIWEWAELSFDKWAAKQLNPEIRMVHAYEHAALATFKKAEELGVFKVLEQTSQHYTHFEKLIKQQFEKYPELKSAYNERVSGKLILKRNERKKQEYALADLIICNSSFTKKTLITGNVEKSKIIVIPLAFPETVKKRPIKQGNIFTFLYAGSLSVRKGTHLLLEIWQKNFSSQTNLELILVGKNLLPQSLTSIKSDNIKIIDFVHQTELEKLYDNADVFVFPTLADGFGMVITEAMARGLPVIASDHSAGPDLIEHQKNGLIAKSGDLEDLTKQMNWCIENKSLLPEISNQALIKANTYQWADYRENLIFKISEKINA
ncbi:MAG: glycosyltransferase [Pedobacter sp.]|nr:MAG: glycosyltransferase [Pedobacter sp.]